MIILVKKGPLQRNGMAAIPKRRATLVNCIEFLEIGKGGSLEAIDFRKFDLIYINMDKEKYFLKLKFKII